MLIYTLLIPVILYFISGALDAVMDTIEDHADISIFWKGGYNSWWLNKDNSKWAVGGPLPFDDIPHRKRWKIFSISFNAPVQFLDGWHFAKMVKELINTAAPLGIIYMVYRSSSAASSMPMLSVLLFVGAYWLSFGIAKNLGFGLFYNKILLQKQYRRKWLFM